MLLARELVRPGILLELLPRSGMRRGYCGISHQATQIPPDAAQERDTFLDAVQEFCIAGKHDMPRTGTPGSKACYMQVVLAQ